jgi:hypothetical protein
MWSEKPFRAARLSLLAIWVLLLGCTLGLLMNWAKLGTQGQSWGLLDSCPICVAAARLIGPIAAVDNASRVAAIMVWTALVLGLLGMAYFAVTRATSSLQTFLIAAGGFILAFAPVVFVMLLPEAVPIHLDAGGYVALFFGVMSLVTATAGLRAEAEEEEWAASDISLDEMEMEQISPRGSEPSAAATYGSLGDKPRRNF